MRSLKRLPLVLVACYLFVAGANAAIIYDESVSGDLSSDNFAPTLLMVAEGSNVVNGSTTALPLDRDFFSFTVPVGLELAALVLDVYDTEDDQGFLAVAEGNQIAALFDASVLLGNALIGVAPGAMEGDDILDNLGVAGFGGTGFVGALGAGTYTFWIQEVSGSVPEYALDFQLSQIQTHAVPLPSSLLLMVAAIALLRRRA
ncbi:MAG: hypothetical protein AB8C02_04840 [Halioglobus sp.]